MPTQVEEIGDRKGDEESWFAYWKRRQTSELRNPNLYLSFVCEFLGTGNIVIFGCGSCVVNDWEDDERSYLQISWTFGLIIATMIWVFGHISGGHINPAITISMLAVRRITLQRTIVYLIAQCSGAIIGAIWLKTFTNAQYVGSLGMTMFTEHTNLQSAFAIETIITFVLSLTVYAATDMYRGDHGGSPAWAIGVSVAVSHMFAIRFTGSSMNPARSLGPAVAMGSYKLLWVYWLAPCLGATLAAFIYEFLLSNNSCPAKIKHYFTFGIYHHDKNYTKRVMSKYSTAIEEKQEQPYTI